MTNTLIKLSVCIVSNWIENRMLGMMTMYEALVSKVIGKAKTIGLVAEFNLGGTLR